MSIIIRGQAELTKFADCMSVCFITFLDIALVLFCVFCVLLFNSAKYVSLLLCAAFVTFIFCYCCVYSVLGILLLLCIFRSRHFVFFVFFCVFLCCSVYRTVPYRTVPYRTVPYRTVPYYCHRVSTQLQLTNISYHNIYHIISYGPVLHFYKPTFYNLRTFNAQIVMHLLTRLWFYICFIDVQ